MPPTPRRPSRRKVSQAYARRNKAARAKGYDSYYDFRAHDNGRIPPGQPRLQGQQLARARGHAAAQDMLDYIRPLSLIILLSHPATITVTNGVYSPIVKQVDRGGNGIFRTFTLRGLTRKALLDLIREEESRGGVFSPAPSLDQREIVRKVAYDGR